MSSVAPHLNDSGSSLHKINCLRWRGRNEQEAESGKIQTPKVAMSEGLLIASLTVPCVIEPKICIWGHLLNRGNCPAHPGRLILTLVELPPVKI